MANWEEQIEELVSRAEEQLEDGEAFDLFTRLFPSSIDARMSVSGDEERLIRIILGHIDEVILSDGQPVDDALWMAFWLGAAWRS